MNGITFVIFCAFAAALVFTVLELMLPSHGVLGVLAAAATLVGIGACFYLNQWAGLGAVIATAVVLPFALSAFVKFYPQTPIGKKMVLRPIDSIITRPPVAVGQEGTAISELRPMGTAEFDGQRIEVSTEIGMIAPATRVKVVSFENNRPVVVAV